MVWKHVCKTVLWSDGCGGIQVHSTTYFVLAVCKLCGSIQIVDFPVN